MRQTFNRFGSLLVQARNATTPVQSQQQLQQLQVSSVAIRMQGMVLSTTAAVNPPMADGAALRMDSQISLLQQQREILPDLSLPGVRRELKTAEIDIPLHAPKVLIEYDPCELDTFLRLVDQIEDSLPFVLVAGNLGVPDGRPGSFEISTEDGTVIFSKLADPTAKLDPRTVIHKLEHHLAEASFTL